MNQALDDEFVPLRKKFKREETGKEDNFVQSYQTYDHNNHLNEAEVRALYSCIDSCYTSITLAFIFLRASHFILTFSQYHRHVL